MIIVMRNISSMSTSNNFKYYYIIVIMMGFDFMCGFADTVKGGGKAMGESLGKIASVFFGR